MPRANTAVQDNAAKAKAYAKANKLSFNATYHLMLAANAADNRGSIGLDPNAPKVSDLSSDDAAALSAAKSALSL